jgi:tetratricopeptide (TPR) repeat protein
LLTAGTAAADQSATQSAASAVAQDEKKPKKAKPAKPQTPPREKPSSPLADPLREAPPLKKVQPDRGLLPGLDKASELQLLAMADAAARRQEFETELHFVANAVARFPDSAKTQQTHIRALLHYGDASEALHQVEKYLKEDDDRELMLLKGDALASLGRIEKAIDVWTEGLTKKQRAQLSGLALNQGRDQARRAHVVESKRMMRRASLLLPENLEAATGVVEMLLKQGQNETAVEWARRVVEKAPRAGFSHGLLGRALLAANRRDDALSSLERSVKLNPGDRQTVRLLIQTRNE